MELVHRQWILPHIKARPAVSRPTAGSVEFTASQLRALVIPLIIEQLLAITVGLLDSIMVSKVGEAAISAVSLVDTVNVLMVNLFASLATGGAVIAGQYLGRREVEKAGHSGSQLLLFMGEVSLVIMVLFYLCKSFVIHVVFGQVEPDVAACADTYYMIVEASIPFLAIYNAGAALFRVMGNSRVSMWVSLGMNAINAVGNGILIFAVHMGVEGVAIPTLVSRAAAAIAMAVLLQRPDLPLRVDHFTLRHDPYVVKNILRFGVPNGLEGGIFQLGKILLLSTASSLGTASVAANAIGNSVTSFQCICGNALGLAMVTVVSRCVGAGDMERSRYYTKKLMAVTYACMFADVLLVFAALPLILRLYNVSPEAESYARTIILLHGTMGLFLWPASFTLPQALRAAGDTRFTMLVSIASMWLLRVGLGMLLVHLGFGVVSIWMAMMADWVCRILFFIPRFHGSRWESMALRD